MTTSTFELFVKTAANLSDLKAALHRYHDDRYDEGLKIWEAYQTKLQQIETYVEGRFDAGDTESEMLKGIPLEFLSFAKDLWGKQLERYGVWGHREFQAAAMSAGWADEYQNTDRLFQTAPQAAKRMVEIQEELEAREVNG
jgi:hypothetical protein